MKQFIVHNSEGVILRTGMCPENVFAEQALENEFVIEGFCNEPGKRVINGEIVDYIEDVVEPSDKEKIALCAALIRTTRNGLLENSDWTQLNDSPLTAEKKAEWQNYRQQLRDLPSQYQSTTDIADVVYPTMPE